LKEKFIYPNETRQLTRDWILLNINKRWRVYKSRLKSKYFKREKKSLAEIVAGVPKGVNAHQWDTLVGFWCQDSHMVMCYILILNLAYITSLVTLVLTGFVLLPEIMQKEHRVCKEAEESTHNQEKKSHARLRKGMVKLFICKDG